jgi:hypothetical protein
VVAVLPDGTYLSVLVNPGIRRARRAAIIEAARAGQDIDPDDAHLVRVVEYDVPDREGSVSGELIVLPTTITGPDDAHAGELASAYHQRWEEEVRHPQCTPSRVRSSCLSSWVVARGVLAGLGPSCAGVIARRAGPAFA